MAPAVARVSVKAVEDYPSSLRHLWSEVGTLELRSVEARDKELANTRVELEREGEGFGIADLTPSAIGDVVTSVPPSVTGDVLIAAPTVEDVAPTN
ncbi:hypothetical protein GOBAR_DD23494 [Gossypium barbadense]|nr:hypothetical protein GOBAR_DD23494 [Gossypium barbadense]